MDKQINITTIRLSPLDEGASNERHYQYHYNQYHQQLLYLTDDSAAGKRRHSWMW